MPFVTLQESGLTPLWTDAPNVADGLRARLASGTIPAADLNDLLHFADHGWLVFTKAIDDVLIDAFVADIHTYHQYPGMFVVTDHRQGRTGRRLSDDQPDRFESLFDLYVNFASARRVCMHPRIVHFLEQVFETPPLAFQQLLFQRSNGHHIHQDPSVVAVEQPLWLAASWVALQDVVEGSGELAFYDRSHRIPQYLFKDGSKRISPGVDDRAGYEAALTAACQGLPYERFMAKKGDVFIWAADLVHQSHRRTLPLETPRLSCVTHYCPMTTTPFWYRFHPELRGQQPYDEAGVQGAFASWYYQLPHTGGMIRPSRTP
jgi:ectoine hydroxylase-related dioxygenase (phytanoyl-CoA dioxygenase family)